MQFILGVLVGAVVASVVWFFVYRNNKAKLDDAIAKANEAVDAARKAVGK